MINNKCQIGQFMMQISTYRICFCKYSFTNMLTFFLKQPLPKRVKRTLDNTELRKIVSAVPQNVDDLLHVKMDWDCIERVCLILFYSIPFHSFPLTR